ncbi:MAG: translocation/assembly module TamB domain-containing protein [Ferruginibacter sp.]
MAHKASDYFSRELKTKVSIKKVNIRFFNKVSLEGLQVEDRNRDTLLYAGQARVKITDWFFLKDKATFTYISLDDALVNMKRKDSTWNYQFLVDYFSSPSGGGKKSKGIEFDFREVHTSNVRFNQIDQWTGRDLKASFSALDVFIKSVDMNAMKASIESVNLENPMFMQYDYTGSEPVTDVAVAPAEENAPVAQKKQPEGWLIDLKKLTMSNGSVWIKKQIDRDPANGHFEGQHLFFSRINGQVNELRFAHDSLQATLRLSALERSGLELKNLSADFLFAPGIMEFRNLDLETNRSRLRDYFAMRFESFNHDMNRFLHNVNLEAHFSESDLSSDDLAYFAPSLSSWKKKFHFTGRAKGTVDNFSTDKFQVSSGNTFFSGEIGMRGLPDINSTFIDLRSDGLKTQYADLAILIPSLRNIKQPSLHKLGNIYYKGNFTGFLNDFVAFGTIKTNLGTLTADLNMKLPENGPARYSGKLLTNNFQLGTFINSPVLGDISLNGKVNGRGLTMKDLDATFNGFIGQLSFNGYRYANITVNGDFRNSLFSGKLQTDDPNLKIRSLDGSINFSGEDLAFNLNSDLDYVNLKNIGLTNEEFTLKGLLSLDFKGNDIDQFLGAARIYDATLTHEGKQLTFDSLRVLSELQDGRKKLSIISNQFEAEINGHVSILDLPNAFKVFLSKYYPSYINKPTAWVGSQDFTFYIKTKEVDEYVRLLDPKLKGFDYSDISGNLNLNNYELNVNASMPSFSYDEKKFSDIRLTGRGNRDTLYADISLSDISLSDSLHFPETRLSLKANNDVSDIKLVTRAGKTLNDAELNASIETMQDGIKVHFSPSYFTINDKKWTLEKDGELTLRKNFLDASEIIFRHRNQQIKLSTELDELTDHTHIVAKLDKVNIEDFTPFFLQKPSLKGILSGTARVREPFGKMFLEFTGDADSLSMDEQYIGKVDLNGSANSTTGMIRFNAESHDSAFDFRINGHYNYLDSTGDRLGIKMSGKKIDLAILKPYLNSIFGNMEGDAEADLEIKGTGSETELTGLVKIRKASLLVAYTQCRYTLENEVVKFEKNIIDLGKLRLKDTLNNTATVTGRIGHHFFDEMSFDNIKLETGKLLVLNTAKKDNKQFYGTVIGSANMSINGPLTNMVMNITGKPSYVDSSHIYLPTGSDRESNAVDYIEFVQFGTLMGDSKTTKESTNILVNLSLTANPACKVDVILDEETGDIIKGQGNGQINIRVGTREPVNIRGVYELTRGQYTFNFQTFLKKQFALNRGTISFNGDPYDALLDLYADYKAERVDISSLTPSGGFRQKEDVYIVSHLTGSLKKPMIDFEFKLPENSEASRNDIIVKRLAEFHNDKTELNKQVASLLLFNSFLLGDQNVIGSSNPISFATNTIGGILSSWLTNIFNKELEKATKGLLSTYLDIDPTLDLQKNAAQIQANIRAGLKLSLNKRLQLILGGNLDYNNPNYSQQLTRRGLITPDISLEYLLTKDGAFRVVGFNRTSIDYTLNQLNRSGLQLSYRKDVNKLSDLFRSQRKKQKNARKSELILMEAPDSLRNTPKS